MNNEALNLYVKTKKDWDKRSSVRTSKEIYDLNLNDINSENTNWHFSTYCPILQHKNLKSLSEPQKKSIMGAQLLEFLIKTTRFEVDYVNKVANNLTLEKYDFNIPKILKLDALKIYTDEGYHAYFSKKISDQIIDYFAIKDDLTPYIISFFNKVDNIGSKYDKKFNYLANLSSVIVSESMICGDISEEMKGIAYEPIRIMFKEHMHDEYFHANYFGTLFKILWSQLTKEEKEIMGFNLCESMVVFAEPRVDIYFYSLSKLGFTKDFISKCIKDIYDTYDWKVNKAKKKMLHALKLLDTCGVFKIPLVNKEFTNKGFI